jgi:predicted deacylase
MHLKTVTFDTLKAGPTFVILGSIHGNEKCGAATVKMLLNDLDSGKIKLQKGRLICIPICNPLAFERNVRFVERNLNRYLYPKAIKTHFEDNIDPIICEILEKADVLLDLHSYASKGGPFIFLGTNKAEQDYARSLGINDFVYGWQEAYGASNKKDGDKESIGTTEFTRSKGGIGITLECGHHHNENNVQIGFNAALKALYYLEMLDLTSEIDKKLFEPTEDSEKQRCLKMKNVYYKEQEGNFAKSWRHFDEIKKDEEIASFADGRVIKAPEDGCIVLPKENAKIGEEWVYFGIKTDFPN